MTPYLYGTFLYFHLGSIVESMSPYSGQNCSLLTSIRPPIAGDSEQPARDNDGYTYPCFHDITLGGEFKSASSILLK